MLMGSGLLALAMLVADGPPCSSGDPTTCYQVRVLTLDGLDWRTAAYPRLTPVARQGTSAIWTADKSLVTLLIERASSVTSGGRIVANGESMLSQVKAVNYVAAMERVADGPINQSSAIAFMPRPEQVEERFAIRLAGRQLDQGVLTRLTLEETHVDVIHNVNQTETVKPVKSKDAPATPVKFSSDGSVTQTSVETPTSLTTQVQIPEVSQTRIDGEWLIPKDGVLLISLGVKTVSDDDGKAVVRERLAVIEANVPIHSFPWSNGGKPPAEKTSAMVMPPTPMRSMPVSVDASGATIDLPPLPEALASNDLDRIKPAPNQPSPQSPLLADPSADAAVARTSFDAAPAGPNPPAPEVVESTANDRMTRLKKLQEAIAKAGFVLEMGSTDFELNEVILKPACEKCDGDSLFCPADARAVKPAERAGGMKFVPERVALGVSIKDAEGNEFKSDSLNLKMNEAFKLPGKTETTLVPLDGKFSLELKATLVPTARATTAKQPESDRKEFDAAVRAKGGLGP